MLPVEQDVSLSATGEARHLTLRVMNSLTCMRASWSGNLALSLTIDELTRPGFYLPLQVSRLAMLSCLTPWTITPCLTLARASQPNNLPFPPCSQRVSPIQAASFHLQSGDSECLPATQLYLSIFNCPTQRVKRQEVKVMQEVKRMPARCSRPDNLTISSLLLDEVYPYDTVSLDLPSVAGKVIPARQPCLFQSHTSDAYSSDTAGIVPPSGIGKSPR